MPQEHDRLQALRLLGDGTTSEAGKGALSSWKSKSTRTTIRKQIVEDPEPTVVDFWGPQCARCLELMPVMEEIVLVAGKARCGW